MLSWIFWGEVIEMTCNDAICMRDMVELIQKLREKLNTLDILGLNFDKPQESIIPVDDVDYQKFMLSMQRYLDKHPENKEDFLKLTAGERLDAKKLDALEVLFHKLSLEQSEGRGEQSDMMDTNKVFLVHGHDEGVKAQVARTLEKLGLEVVIINEKVNAGATIIEKIERNANVGYGVVLYTPCDEGRPCNENGMQKRARQNVVFEHGYLMGKLGRDHVCALRVNEVEIPSDLSGVIYISMDSNWKVKLIDEMNAVGFHLDKNNL